MSQTVRGPHNASLEFLFVDAQHVKQPPGMNWREYFILMCLGSSTVQQQSNQVI